MKSSRKEKSLEEAIIDLYISIKKEEESYNYDEKTILSDVEKLKKIDSLIIIDYIKSSIEILVNFKVKKQVEEFMKEINNNNFNLNSISEYEELLCKSEADVRNHIRIEHQLKLYTESLKQRIEDLERSKAELKKNLKYLHEQFNKSKLNEGDFSEKKDKEIKHLTIELENLKSILNSYEGQNSKIAELEIKLRNINLKHNKEMKLMEDKYKEEINYLNKHLSHYEDIKSKIVNYQNKQVDKYDKIINPFNNQTSRDNNRDPTSKYKNYIEAEEEISHFNYERNKKIISRSTSPITDRINNKDKNELRNMNTNRIQNQLDSLKNIENIIEKNKTLKHRHQGKRRNYSNDYNEDFTSLLKIHPDKNEQLVITKSSDQDMKVVINKLNFANLNNNYNKKNESNTDRSSSSRKSNLGIGSQNSHRSSNASKKCSKQNTLKYSSNQKDINSSVTLSPEVNIIKQYRHINPEVNIRDYIYSKLNKCKGNSKILINNVNGPIHVRSSSGFTFNNY